MAPSTPSRRRWQAASVWLLYVVGLLPAAWEFYRGATDDLGADPVKTFELFLGLWAVRFLILSLSVSPLRELFKLNLFRYRRAVGLLAFYYVLMHFTVYLVLDQELNLGEVLADVLKRPFIMLGMASLVLLIPLAVTSNAFSIRRLGGKWRRLHQVIYIVVLGVAIHLALATKVLSAEQYLYLSLFAVLIAYRLARPFLKGRRKLAPTTLKASPSAVRH